MFWRHPGVAFWCHVCSQINKKNNYGIRAAIGWSKWRKSHQYGSKVGPKGVPKSIKNLLKSKSGPKVSCWVSLGASGSTKWCPGPPKSHPGMSKCSCQASEKVSQIPKMQPRVYQIVNQLLARWRGVNNWIYIYIFKHIYLYMITFVSVSLTVFVQF